MNHLKYCPECGQASLRWDNTNKLSCSQCQFVMYQNCAAAVAVIIRCGKELMFTQRNQEPKKGKLDLSGGFVDPKESAEEACKRELWEELKYDIDLQKLKLLATQPNVYHYKNIDYNTLDLFFEYEVVEKFTAQLALDEIDRIVWVEAHTIQLEDLAFDSQKRFLKGYIGSL